MRTLLLYFVTAMAEIVGCYLPWLWLKKGGSVWLLLPAAVSLAAFAWLLTLHEAASGGGELDMHAATLHRRKAPSSLKVAVTNVPPQHFYDHDLETRASAEGTFRKGAKIGVKCRTPVSPVQSI